MNKILVFFAAGPSGNLINENHDGLSIVGKNGQLWKAVNHEHGIVPLPNQGNKLPDWNLSKINTWINAGSSNN